MGMKPATRAKFLEAAELFRRRAPWKDLSDMDHFGLRDSAAGMTGWASVLGSGKMEFGLSMMLGEQALEQVHRLRRGDLDIDEFGLVGDLLSVSFDAEAAIPPEFRRKARILRLPGNDEEVVTIWRKEPHRTPRPETDAEARFLTAAMHATLRLLKERRLGGTADRAAETLPLFTFAKDPAGAIEMSLVPRPPKSASPAVESPPELSRTLAGLTPRGTLVVTLPPVPASVKGEMMRVLLILDPESGRALGACPFTGPKAAEEAALALCGAMTGAPLMEGGGPIPFPERIVIDSPDLHRLLAGYLGPHGVRVIREEHIPGIEEVVEGLIEHVMNEPGE